MKKKYENNVNLLYVKPYRIDVFSWAIMAYTESDYSHVAIQQGNKVYHAGRGGVVIDDYITFTKECQILASQKIELGVSKDFFKGYMLGREGTEYAEAQILNWLFKYIPFCQNLVIRNQKRKVICSEFVAWTLHELKAKGLTFDPHQMENISPADLYKQIQEALC